MRKKVSANRKKYFDANMKMWDEKTPFHTKSSFYDVDRFIRGASSLNQIELDALGDIEGKKLLHLQCHFGLDTLSLGRLGAHVTGVDFSIKSIESARKLADKIGIRAEFIHSNVYEIPASCDNKFDIVFTSYGVLGWLPDLAKWAEVVSRSLKPGGIFYIVEFHPVVWMFDSDFKKIEYPYSSAEVIEEIESGTYADPEAPIRNISYGWNHGIGYVLTSLIDSGLSIKCIREHYSSPYNIFPNPVRDENGYWMIDGLDGKIPMLYSIKAAKE
jgi:ubiquinone/menaquinone biosynthesis C-methylase UbiE